MPGTITAIACRGGAEVARHVLTTPGEPAALRLRPHKRELAADGRDTVCVEAAVVDAAGAMVPVSGTPVRFGVEGPAANAGVANGNVISDELWQGDVRSTWNGRCILMVRAGRSPGPVRIAATADGLAPAGCRLETVRRG